MEEKIKYLCRYHNMIVKIEKKKALIKEYDRLSLSIPGPRYGDPMPHSPNRNLEAPFVKWLYKKMEEEEKLKALESEVGKVKEEIINTISALENEDYQRLLIYRYIDWLTWGEIQDKLFISRATANRWHNASINLLKIESFGKECVKKVV